MHNLPRRLLSQRRLMKMLPLLQKHQTPNKPDSFGTKPLKVSSSRLTRRFASATF
ncbi:hypothetical protein GALMADRAFT_1130040 [Galerina marginata CBS 339.88]|uniref:Uncharacterized protein n=1 Tax=Galerina marginata (strain CBS 339.88) TaxID=685588 RepID=A0A067S8J4_GALM3|nr:hypothetical protein GALMADRAFT_1130040 [Galerina marginata CBS 339.88]